MRSEHSLKLHELEFSENQIKLATQVLNTEPGFTWLDSSNTNQGEYSYLCWNPLISVRASSNLTEIIQAHPKLNISAELNVLDLVSALLTRYKQPGPVGFCCGWVVALSYDFGIKLEGLDSQHSEQASFFSFFDSVIRVNHQTKRIELCSLDLVEPHEQLKEKITLQISEAIKLATDKKDALAKLVIHPALPEISFDTYKKLAQKILDLIQSGEIYQANLSYRINTHYTGNTFSLYETLRELNPAPYSAFHRFEKNSILSSSPELFLSKRGNNLLTMPIKGTRKRDANSGRDQALARDLLESPKEQAELSMIIDLERNDFSKIASPGTVKLAKAPHLQKYATVQHLVANVEAEVPATTTCADLIKAIFPGGSITGAPKYNAISILDATEKSARGFYTGSLGYASLNGDMDLNILIRSIFASESTLSFGTGGGLVADSDIAMEYKETLDKAQVLLQALDHFSK